MYFRFQVSSCLRTNKKYFRECFWIPSHVNKRGPKILESCSSEYFSQLATLSRIIRSMHSKDFHSGCLKYFESYYYLKRYNA